MNEYEVERGASFTSEKTRVQTLRHTETSQVKYDLIGKITEGTSLTRKTVSAILQGINIKKFYMFRNNPEEFITKVIRLINEQKATMIVDHISYDTIEGKYDSTIFTAEKIRRALIRHSLQKKQFRIMYLRMVLQKRVLKEDLQKIWMRRKKYVFTQNFREHFKYLLPSAIILLTGLSLSTKERLNISSLLLKQKEQWKRLILDR